MFYKVRLTNNSIEESTAEIVPYNVNDGLNILVYSSNLRMKSHLESILTQEAYILSPGRVVGNITPDGVLRLYPGTVEYLQALPEIMSWRGYTVSFVNETHKSIDYLDYNFTLKAVDDNIYTNANGERIVKIVPQGHIAVHVDGRMVAAGRWLNANIDKEGSEWTLEENPYEEYTPEQRDSAKQYMDMFVEDYHPGVQEELYKKREQETDDYYQEEDYQPTAGKTLAEFYPVEEENISGGNLEETKSLPMTIPPGKVLYSPTSGLALASELWPPTGVEGFEKMRWYVFDDIDMSDEDKSAYADMLGISSPQLAPGLKTAPVQLDTDLDVSEAFRLSIPGFSNGDIVLNIPNITKIKLDELSNDPDYRTKAKEASDRMNVVKGLVKYRDPETGEYTLHPSLDELEVDDLRGANANFMMDLYSHQKAGVAVLTDTTQYEAFGGPKGWHGQFISSYYGSGKTAMILAADAILRNKGVFKTGEQVTIITAPNKNTFVWQSEAGKFRDEDAIVIDGGREDRVEQWERILERARDNTLPNLLVVGSSKFRFSKGVDTHDDEEAWELGLDAQYMKLLALGGSSHDKNVKGGHVSALVLDESGQYVNSNSARHSAVAEITDAVYYGKGVTWTLNGDMSGNSSSDTISEMSFINKYVRDNYVSLVNEYTKSDQATSGKKNAERRIWKNGNFLIKFMNVFRPQIFSLKGQVVVGKKWGLTYTDDVTTPIGANWGEVYKGAWNKIISASANKQMRKALGAMQIMINSSLGAVQPARLIEYGLGMDELISGVKDVLPPEEFAQFQEGVIKYQQLASQETIAMGRVAASMDIPKRDKLFKQIFTDTHLTAMNVALRKWNSPIVDTFMSEIDNRIVMHEAGKSCKIGVGGFSKTFINALGDKLRDKYGDNVLIQVVDGDTSPEDVNAIQTRHQDEKGRPVITLVTSAGLYGLSLPSDYGFRLPTWNSAKAGQYEGRFHRNALQKNITTIALPDGICQYMREMEQVKRSLEEETRGVASFNADDDSEEISIKGINGRLLEKLAQYRPRILKGEED